MFHWRKYIHLRSSAQLKEMYAFNILFSFAAALIIVFEPVFFYRQGFALYLIAGYYAAHYVLYVLLMPLGSSFAARFGLEKSLSVSVPLFVIYFLLLSLIGSWPQLFLIAWVLLTFFKIFYWPAYHAMLCQFGDKFNRGTEISWFYAIERGVGVAGPLIGGFIIAWFGFTVLFVITAGVALLSVVPLLRTREKYNPVWLPYRAPWQIIAGRQHRHYMIGTLGWGENLIDLVIWPIFMLTIVGSEAVLGIIGTLNSLVMAVLGFFIGEMSDRWSRRKILRVHIPFMMIGYLLRPWSLGIGRVVLTDMLAKAAFIGLRVPLWHKIYQQGAREGALKYVTAVEIVLAIAKALTAAGLAVVFYLWPEHLAYVITFVLAALLSLFYFAI